MYQQFYGLKDIPFSLAPDPTYLFKTESLLEVFATLQYGIENGKGIVIVTGEVGAGKTTILRSMLQSLDRSILAAYIFNPLLSSKDFFDLLCTEFRLQPQPSKAAMLRQLGELLMRRHRQGLSTVLVIDEAHLLPTHLLEEIRLLSNFETTREKLLQIVLCGQPELQATLLQPEQRQLKQRISLKTAIQTLAPRETAEYIRWRLRVAGAKNDNLFDADAVKLIQQLSNGIPRIINNICDNALLSGFAQERQSISVGIIREVADELDLMPVEYGIVNYSAAEIAAEIDEVFERFSEPAESTEKLADNVHYLNSSHLPTNWENEQKKPSEPDSEANDSDVAKRFFKRMS